MTKRGNKVQTQVHIRRDFSGIHDSYCRCQSCKPPMPGEGGELRYLIGGAILALLLLGVLFYG